MRAGIVFWTALVVSLAAAAAPQTGSVLSSSEHPVSAGPAPQIATYGLCSGPQNAEAFPSRPVPDIETQCEFTQQYQATSPNASYGGSCGGYTVAFGPQGDLKRKRKYLWLVAEWGDAPLTQANCASAHLAAAAWGYLCSNAACSSGAWERIGTAKTAHGNWNTVSQVCYLSINANVGPTPKDYSTVNIDVIASQGSGSAAVRKRAKASIYNKQPNGKCPTATYSPR
jgi:hypothetical protein